MQSFNVTTADAMSTYPTWKQRDSYSEMKLMYRADDHRKWLDEVVSRASSSWARHYPCRKTEPTLLTDALTLTQSSAAPPTDAMTSQADPKSTPRRIGFLSLPPELRLLIYDTYLSIPRVGLQYLLIKPYDAFFWTCKTIRMEALEFLYANCILKCIGGRKPNHIETALLRLSPRQRNLITNFQMVFITTTMTRSSVQFEVYQDGGDLESLRVIRRLLPKLKNLTIRLSLTVDARQMEEDDAFPVYALMGLLRIVLAGVDNVEILVPWKLNTEAWTAERLLEELREAWVDVRWNVAPDTTETAARERGKIIVQLA